MRPQRQTIKPGTLPVPVAGINAISSLSSMAANEAIDMVNIEPTTRGIKVRSGYELFEDITAASGTGLTTLIPYTGSGGSSGDRLFVGSVSDYYDITSGTASVESVGFTGTHSGSANFDTFTNDNGDSVLLLLDDAEGLWVYSQGTDSWAQGNIPSDGIGGPNGTGAKGLVNVLVWKNRVWYKDRIGNRAWYTDVGTYEGTLTKFNFGNKFIHGGKLLGLYSWTLDGADGPDDYLVALSSSGDVVLYQGTDPSSAATFGIVGSWFVGPFPAARKIAAQFGGDLLLLSTYGVISMTDLLSGKSPFTHEGSISYKINPLLRTIISGVNSISSGQWGIHVLPEISKILITASNDQVFAYDINLKAWAIWEDLRIYDIVSFKNEIYFVEGLSNSQEVWQLTGSLDNGNNIQWSFQTAYSDLEEPQIIKKVEFIQPNTPNLNRLKLNSTYIVEAQFDYTTTVPPVVGESYPVNRWGGLAGMGKTISIRMSGETSSSFELTDFGLMWRSGSRL